MAREQAHEARGPMHPGDGQASAAPPRETEFEEVPERRPEPRKAEPETQSLHDLVPIQEREMEDGMIQTVDGRNLHAALKVGRDFSTWMTRRIAKYGFVEGVDFCSPDVGSKTGSGGHNAKEYFVSLDMAKELAMVENNPTVPGRVDRGFRMTRVGRRSVLARRQLRRQRVGNLVAEQRRLQEVATLVGDPMVAIQDVVHAAGDPVVLPAEVGAVELEVAVAVLRGVRHRRRIRQKADAWVRCM
jgi:phage anti-repressor protein